MSGEHRTRTTVGLIVDQAPDRRCQHDRMELGDDPWSLTCRTCGGRWTVDPARVTVPQPNVSRQRLIGLRMAAVFVWLALGMAIQRTTGAPEWVIVILLVTGTLLAFASMPRPGFSRNWPL